MYEVAIALSQTVLPSSSMGGEPFSTQGLHSLWGNLPGTFYMAAEGGTRGKSGQGN